MLQISVDKIDWIANSVGKSPQELAETIAPKKTAEFLEGRMGRTALRKLADLANQPLGFLFHKAQLENNNPDIPDLRQIQYPDELSQEFYEVVKDVRIKIEWYKDYLKQIGLYVPLPFVGKYTYSSTLKVEEVVNDIRETINYDETFPRVKEGRVLLNQYVGLFEELGILILRNTMVGNNTRKTLSLEEFRGFAITDKYVPTIFINRKDSYKGSLFTLLHEVAHIWLGVEGVTNTDWEYLSYQSIQNNEAAIEKFCNKVAAEILMPKKEFIDRWNKDADVFGLITRLSDYFNASELAISIKAYELGFVDSKIVGKIKSETEKRVREKAARKSTGGPAHLTMVPIRNSQRFTNAVVTQVMGNNLSWLEASKLIRTRPENIRKLYERQLGNI